MNNDILKILSQLINISQLDTKYYEYFETIDFKEYYDVINILYDIFLNIIERIPFLLTLILGFISSLSIVYKKQMLSNINSFFLFSIEALLIIKIIKYISAIIDTKHKWAFRPRIPQYDESPGFPSSHTSMITYFATITILYSRNIKSIDKINIHYSYISIILFIVSLAVAFERVYSQAHTLLQTIFGFIFGISWGIFCYYRL